MIAMIFIPCHDLEDFPVMDSVSLRILFYDSPDSDNADLYYYDTPEYELKTRFTSLVTQQ